jgi:hypothetical protein
MDNSINFDNVSEERAGCGFRHEKFPDRKPNEQERQEYFRTTQLLGQYNQMLYEIPQNLQNRTFKAYIEALIEKIADNKQTLQQWWDQVRCRYNLPSSTKYNPNANEFFRHITDDNEVSDAENINQGQWNQNQQQGNQNQGQQPTQEQIQAAQKQSQEAKRTRKQQQQPQA